MVIPGVIPAVIEGASLLYHTLGGTSSPAGCCRTATIDIHNRNKHLEFLQPEYHLYSGVNYTPPAPLIRPDDKVSCTFRKVYNSSYGTAGVVTYGIQRVKVGEVGEVTVVPEDDVSRLVLMWSVPLFGATQHAIGIERAAAPMPPVGWDLYQKLYYGEDKWFQRQVAGEGVKYDDTVFGLPISILGSISNDGHATWTIEIE